MKYLFFCFLMCCVLQLAGCAGYPPVSGIHGLTNVVFFDDPNNDQVKMAGTLYDVYPEKYKPIGSTRSFSEGVPWAYDNEHIETEASFGSGTQNSSNIIQNQGGDPQVIKPNVTDPTPYAAWLCEQLSVDVPGPNDYEDWFLPSVEELQEMHKAMLTHNDDGKTTVPREDMEDMNKYWRGMFWSSTEASTDDSFARYVNFWDAVIPAKAGEFRKDMYAKVRCAHEL